MTVCLPDSKALDRVCALKPENMELTIGDSCRVVEAEIKL